MNKYNEEDQVKGEVQDKIINEVEGAVWWVIEDAIYDEVWREAATPIIEKIEEQVGEQMKELNEIS